MFTWRFPIVLVSLLQHHNYRAKPYLYDFWHTEDFSSAEDKLSFQQTTPARVALGLLYAIAIFEIAAGSYMLWHWYDAGADGWWGFGFATLIMTPVVLAHFLVLFVIISYIVRPKYVCRRVISSILALQVRQLRKRHQFKVIAVAGSVGKTSTKAAIAKTLGASNTVLWQEGNYNVDVSVPLVFFSQPLPPLFNIAAWLKIFMQNQKIIAKPYPYDVIVVELGTDGPGQLETMGYIRPDIAVITAITPEHMEYFGTMDEVAKEELSVIKFAEQTVINIDDVAAEYLDVGDYISYGLTPKATYYARSKEQGLKGQEVTFYLGKKHKFTVAIPILGEPGAKAATAAVAVAHLLGESNSDIEAGVSTIEAFPGRMRILNGIKKTTLIDDTYNASPIAVKAALDVLYSAKAPQRIAILGSMNELGDYTQVAHEEVGDYCDPKHLDYVVTIGTAAREHLAPKARKNGCNVHAFDSPYAAGEFVKKKLKKSAIILAKGSQSRVFAEEALKPLLANQADAAHFVRQSDSWLAKKREQFSDYR